MRYKSIHNSQGVALIAALFVLMVMSILAIGLLVNVSDEIDISYSSQQSELALKIAETGVQVARSTFFDPAVSDVTDTEEFSSIDGFYKGGYFHVQMKSGFQGAEKWVQWRYDEEVTGNNILSEVSAPVFHVWRTGAPGVNGSWASNGRFYIDPVYGIVARGTYFPIENTSGDTQVRAHDEYSGETKVDTDDPAFGTNYYWRDDKRLTTTLDSLTVNYAVDMSPMVSFSNYSSKTGEIEPVLDQQTLYFAYSGSDTNLSGAVDRSSTVRLRAVNALCHGGADTNYDEDGEPLKALWEFDTGMHGFGTAPAFYDPDPETPGDEILYFAVVARGTAGSPGALNLNSTAAEEFRVFPSNATDDPEQIYLFAVVDTTGKPADCTATGSYEVKWARPFPDPDVVEWTDYPTEHATGTDGTDPPYVRRPSDMMPFLPEEDLLVDYRDGPGTRGSQVRTDGTSAYDGQWNQIRGNLFGNRAGMSPPVVKALYRDSDGNLTDNRARATADSQFDPQIDIYIMYSVITRLTYLRTVTAPWVGHWYWNDVRGPYGVGWGPAGYRKPIEAQVRLLALRDRLVSIKDGSGDHASWDWNAARSRYPTLKWTTPAPGWDPDQTHDSPDDRPWNGYGQYTWDTWFEGQISPMINSLEWDEEGSSWASVTGGAETLYNVIYPYYMSAGFPHGGAENNTHGTGRTGPSTTQGSPKDFSVTGTNAIGRANIWTDNHIMLMAIRDTWDDYMAGNQTNIRGVNNANLDLCNPVEPYWTHKDGEGVGGATGIPTEEQSLITYSAALNAPYRANASKVGFPRPYSWWEALWTVNVRDVVDPDHKHDLYGQGWEGVITGAMDTSLDADIEGETAAMCPSCLQGEGLLVLPFNHDLDSTGDSAGYSADDREDLRIHAINATNGLHVWDYHMPAALLGDDANNTPAIANNHVFVAYEKFGDKSDEDNRKVLMSILDADVGTHKQTITVDGSRADAVVLPPVIANGAVYVGTYTMGNTRDNTTFTDDYIRLFAMSPVIRLVSTGIYPFDQMGAEYPYGYRHYTGGNFSKISSLDHDKIFMNISAGETRAVWKRKIQVWVTGNNSKWEEVREVLED